jgi:hypothetical protein
MEIGNRAINASSSLRRMSDVDASFALFCLQTSALVEVVAKNSTISGFLGRNRP